MDAGSISLVKLISDKSKRFIVPVYQRPYSWDEEQCEQLWNDVLAVGRRGHGQHFTGSVVWIQDGPTKAVKANPVLLIDGQQRIATLELLLVALADYARNHAEKSDELVFSYQSIINDQYLVDPDEEGEEHYRLCLSQGDSETFRSIIGHLEDSRVAVTGDSRRLIGNLRWFRERLEQIADSNIVWEGLGRLQVVSVSLDQEHDDPQVIFESMNSTGKDLSTADLVRNYVLLGQPVDTQGDLYEHHWRPIEAELGVDSYDDVFDEFLYDWLAVINAPRPVNARDAYRFFKEHVQANAYDEDGRMVELLGQMRRFAGYYSRINGRVETDPEIGRILGRIHALDMSVVNPLLMSLLDDYRDGDGSFSRKDLISMLGTVESYLLRRIVCQVPSNGLNKFLLSVMARLDRIQEDGGSDYRQAFEAILLGGVGTNRRMPDDEEFRQALLSRDFYPFNRCYYMLATLENGHHPKNPIDFSSGNHTIEHILPQNALAHEEWRRMLGPDCETVFAEHVNKLGNLTLTAYNSELSDGLFDEKQKRIVGGYQDEYLSISRELHDTQVWNARSIEARTRRLADEALKVWPMPTVDPVSAARYQPDREVQAPAKTITLRMIGAQGLLKPGDRLESLSRQYAAAAVITSDMRIRVAEGEEYDSPSPAASHVLELAGAGSSAINGWRFWSCGGASLDELRARYLALTGNMDSLDRSTARTMFWEGFADFCAGRDDFMAAFGPAFTRADHTRYGLGFGSPVSGCNLVGLIGMRDGYTTVEFLVHDPDRYARFLERRPQVESDLSGQEGDLAWDEKDADKKSRHLTLTRHTDFKLEDWDDIYRWLADALLAMKSIGRYVG